ncbi:MAG: hypothetical protein AAGC55_13885, partial [Myxococcota bacterium]
MSALAWPGQGARRPVWTARRRMRAALPSILMVALVASTALAGCRDRAAGGTDRAGETAGAEADDRTGAESDSNAPSPRFTTEEEQSAFEQEVTAAIEANRARRCPRPVLRGPASPGRAAGDMIAAFEGASDTRACLSGLAGRMPALTETLTGSDRDGWPARSPPAVSGQLSGDALGPLLSACAPMLDRVRAAVQREDGCSPYRAGVRAQPDDLATAMATSQLIAAAARDHLVRGELDAGFDLALDLLRLSHDRMRGGVSLLEVSLSGAAIAHAAGVIELGLNRAEAIGPDRLARIDSELAALLATAPHPSSYVVGERDHLAVYTLLPMARGPDWTPPGGWGQGTAPGPNAPLFARADGVDRGDSATLSWLAIDQLWARVAAACPPDRTPRQCFDAVQAEIARIAEAAGQDPSPMAMMARAARDPDARAAVRQQLIDRLGQIAVPSFGLYIDRDGQQRFQIAALRLHAAYRRRAEV